MMTTAARKQPKEKRRELAPLEPVDASYGAAMAQLNERQRLFVRALFESPKKHGAAVFAARAAAYGTPTSSAQSMASIASRLCSDPKIQDAIQEESRKYVTTLGPMAVRALKNLLGATAHKDHGRAVGILMERIAPVESTHTVRVTHDATPNFKETAQVLDRIAELAAKFSVRLPSPNIIEGEIVETKSQALQ
jgi:phage terminase small subunit